MNRNWIGNRRAGWHDYTSKRIYHITLSKNPSAPCFGTLAGDYAIPAGQPGSAYLEASALGKVVKNCLRDFPTIHPALRVYQYALMPDHIHIVLSVEHTLDEPVGCKLAAFKVKVNKEANIDRVFEPGFNDQILTTTRKLDTIFRYLRENPTRLAIRKAHPDYFQRVSETEISGTLCFTYGNSSLLFNPFKEQVIVHRADTDDEFQRKKDLWLHTAANGGVLVSPFISRREKEVRIEAEALGGRFIIVGNESLGQREKPAKHYFDLCSQGRLLYISPKETIGFSRAACRIMNTLAQLICSEQTR